MAHNLRWKEVKCIHLLVFLGGSFSVLTRREVSNTNVNTFFFSQISESSRCCWSMLEYLYLLFDASIQDSDRQEPLQVCQIGN